MGACKKQTTLRDGNVWDRDTASDLVAYVLLHWGKFLAGPA